MAGKKAKGYTGRKRSKGKSAPRKSPPKTRAKVKRRKEPRGTKQTLALVGDAIGINNMDGAVVQDCHFSIVEDKAPICILIQGIEFRQVGSLLLVQPKPPATIEAKIGHPPLE